MQSSIFYRRFIIVSNELNNLITYYKEKKLAHAYLISTNNIDKTMQILLNVIKNIFCIKEFKNNCKECSLCHLIEINNLPSLKIIEPDGQFITKDQILELKNIFSKDSVYTNESIYIIKNAEKMNKYAANTMLKFLEEPAANVIGFFITNDRDNVMLTIQSRCQIIESDFQNSENEEFNLDNESYQKCLASALSYLNKIEIEKHNLILNNKIYLNGMEKEDVKVILKIILKIYQQALHCKIKAEGFPENISCLEKLSVNNLKQKVNLVIGILNEINYNVNVELLLDKFVIKVDDINNESL